MSKLSIRRILIKDLNGLLYEICGISNPKDRFGEYYVKIVFPKYEYTKLIAQNRDQSFRPTSYEEFGTRVIDFTYHYNAGVAHYKTSMPGYMDQIRKLPILRVSKGLDLITYTLFTLIPMKTYNVTKILSTDLVLKNPFNNMPRDIQIILSNDPDVRVINAGSAKLLFYTTFPLQEHQVYMTISDSERREKSNNPTIITQLYRNGDPIRFLKKPKSL